MMKMIIEFDEEKTKRDGVSLELLYSEVNEIFEEKGLRVCENGVYSDNGGENDLYQFVVLSGVFPQWEWFVKYIKRWAWYGDSESEEFNDLIKTFEIER